MFNLKSFFLELRRGLDVRSAVAGRRSDVLRRAPACLGASRFSYVNNTIYAKSGGFAEGKRSFPN